MAQDHAPKIPIEQRKTRGPGPGTYDVRGGPTGTSFVMGSRWKDPPPPDQVAAPGRYNPVLASCGQSYAREPAYSIGTSPRFADSKRGKATIGPGTYAPVPVSTASPRPVIGNTPRKGVDEQRGDKLVTPGPGSYPLPKLAGGPNYSSVPRRPMAKLRERAKPGEADTATPGPGTYNVGDAEKAKPNYMGKIEWKFGSEARIKPDKKAAIPAPGAYGTKTFIGQGNGLSYSMTPRRGMGTAKEFM